MRIAFSPFVLEDYEAVHALWAESEGIGLYDVEDSLEGIQRYLERNPRMSLVAREGEQVVGAILCGHDGRRGYIHHLAVHPDRRRHGIGRRLVEGCLERLKAIHIRKCHIFIFNKNDEGTAFWEGIGWTPRSDIRIMSKNIEPEEGTGR